MSQPIRPALFTAIYPGVEPYLAAWYASVRAQTRQIPVWIATQGISPEGPGFSPGIHWIDVPPDCGIGAVRQAGIAAVLAAGHDAIIFVDSDDELMPQRVEWAVSGLEDADVVACRLRLIDADGADLGVEFGPPAGSHIDDTIVRVNAFGLSNTAYRAEALSRALPIPSDCDLVDWFLATRAWASGARFGVDDRVAMRYRQHGRNLARVIPPFDAELIRQATARVMAHYDRVAPRLPDGAPKQAVLAASARARRFAEAIRDDETLTRYLNALNRLPGPHLWWAAVAHPMLEDVWNRS